MVRLPALLVVLSLSGSLARVASRPSTPVRQPFTDREMQCFAEEKVLHPDGKCYKLKMQGPCRENEWLIYDDSPNSINLTLVCRVRRCNTVSLPVYWPDDGQCHKWSDKKTLCRYQGNQLRSDSFGNGECACESKYARFETEVMRAKRADGEWPGEGQCYPLFYRGPCPMGKLLFPKVLQGFGLVAYCVQDHCSSQNNGANPNVSYVMRKEDRRCYQLDKTGPPCGPTEIFAVHPMAHLPTCYGTTTTLFSGSVQRCGGEININKVTGECREELILQVQSFGFETTRKRRTRRRAGK